MNNLFKNINLGSLIKQRVDETQTEMSRICNFFKCTEDEIENMYLQENLTTNTVLKWSKLLEYDFFRLYSQHLILYSPPSATVKNKQSSLPHFRKSIYTAEIIDFIVEMVDTGEKSRTQIMKEYNIPKTTLYKWMEKYRK
ncbi:transposase [Chryseobacterium pennae]|uniref:Transposase n=1 Tax=Chryseobacterium pennae TaxID=2258962 RepID=A0A3D9CDK2_9FLAO|nr:helix-turn-helix domain-containing protein [Chryseobacterium pennae]REC63562.1 transposase [Chryseobacterium pennae]